jgi:hypothetical protein
LYSFSVSTSEKYSLILSLSLPILYFYHRLLFLKIDFRGLHSRILQAFPLARSALFDWFLLSKLNAVSLP